MGACFPGSPCCTWTVTNGNILYLTFFSQWEVMQHNFFQFLLLHTLHTLGCYCTFQNNPRLSLGNFSFSTYTPSSCACVHWCVLSHLTHHHSSKIFFCHAGGGVILLLCLLLTHHHPHVSSHITHHNSHPNVTCSFICTKLKVPSHGGGWVLLNTNCHQATEVWLVTPN